MMFHYNDTPPKGYTAYETSPNSSNENYIYYAPQQHYGNTPTKRHSRKTSWTPNSFRTPGGWHSPAGYPSDQFYEAFPSFASPPHKGDVSGTKTRKTKLRSYTASGGRGSGAPPRTQKQYIYVDDTEDADNSPRYEYREPQNQRRYSKPSADQMFYFRQEPTQYDDTPKRTRTRRSSTNTRSPQKSSKSTHIRPSVKATEADAARMGIPTGYSIKNWDPTESPIVLLGSVFDANSLGKWIYDWTVYHHGASTPMADVAGDLWLLLIKLAGKMKRAEECVRRIRNLDNRDMVEDFILSGSRLWQKFKELLRECERYMWKAAKREGGKGISMGKNAGIEFVESIFGRDRQLETTERLMNSIRLWNMRFDANCEDILRRPSAS